jgi:hypothetical protein
MIPQTVHPETRARFGAPPGTKLLPDCDRCNHGERNQTTASLYIQGAELGTFQPLNGMAYSMREKRKHLAHANPWLLAALFGACFVMPLARAQQFGQGFSGPGQAAPANPAESAAFSAAIGQPNAEMRVWPSSNFSFNIPTARCVRPLSRR